MLFCDAVGRPDLKARYDEANTPTPQSALRSEVAALIAERTQAEWNSIFDGVDCCVTPVLTLAEALQHPQFVSRGMSVKADGMTQLAPPFRMSGWAFSVERSAPAPGEHADAILAEAGYTPDEIERLRQSRIV